MPEFRGYKYFLLSVDVFNHMVRTKGIKDKTSESVQKAFTSIFSEARIQPNQLETDSG
jgi:hypothetical protein